MHTHTDTNIHTHFNSPQSTEQCNITRTTHGCAQILKTYITIFSLHVCFLSNYIDKCMSATFNILSLTHTHTLSHLSLFLSLLTTHSHTHTQPFLLFALCGILVLRFYVDATTRFHSKFNSYGRVLL